MKRRWIISVLMAPAGFLTGYIMGPLQTMNSSQSSVAPDTLHLNSEKQAEPTRTDAEQSMAFTDRKAALTAGLRFAVSQLSNAHRSHDLMEFFRDVTTGEMVGIAEELMELPDATRWLAMGALMDRWVELDPEAAAAFVSKAPGDRADLENAFTHAWALHDPEAVIRWAQQLPYSHRMDVQRSIANALSWKYRDDPAKGVTLLLEAGMLREDHFGGGAIFAAWAKRDPRAALACAAGVENTKLRRGLMENALKGWAQSDSAKAAAWCRQIPDANSRNEATAAVAIGMAGTDLEQGLALARSLPEGRTRDRTMASMAIELLWSSRGEAVQILAAIPFETGNEALEYVYNSWASDDAGAAAASLCERLDRLPAGTEERFAVEKFLEESQDFFSRFGSDAVVKALAHGMSESSGEPRARTLEKAAEKWASQNPVEARTWAEALPEGAARERALAGIARGWTGGSITEAAAWLDALPASPSRDAAVGSFARTVLARDPAGALAWMRTIPDSDRRLATLQTAWADWMKDSPKAAAEWRKSSPDLTAAERSHLRSPH